MMIFLQDVRRTKTDSPPIKCHGSTHCKKTNLINTAKSTYTMVLTEFHTFAFTRITISRETRLSFEPARCQVGLSTTKRLSIVGMSDRVRRHHYWFLARPANEFLSRHRRGIAASTAGAAAIDFVVVALTTCQKTRATSIV